MATLFELAARLQAAGAAEAMLLLIVKVTLVLAIAKLLVMAMPHSSAATKHLVATAALIAVAAMPFLTAVTPSWHLGVLDKLDRPAPSDAKKTVGATGEESADSEPGVIGTGISLARATGVAGLAEQPLTVAARAINVTKASWKGMIVLAVMLVGGLMLLQMLVGMLGVWYVARNAEELTQDTALVELDHARDHLALGRDVRLLRSSRISVPVIWGIFKPVLLLPADVVTWPAERLRVVLLHELAHLKRLDGLSLICTRIAVSLFWFHPLAWSLERAGRTDCERACDDLVLASGTKPSDYADHLLAIARSMPTFDPFRSVTLAMSRKSQLEGRLLSILHPQTARRIFTARGVAFACAIGLMIVIPVSAMRLAAAPKEDKAKVEYAVKKQEAVKSDSEVTVTPDVEAIGDFFLAKFGKTGDKFARVPKNGEQWYQRAYDLYHADRYAEAAVAFQHAAESDYRKAAALYNAACSYSLNDDRDNALKLLAEAIAAGWDDMDHIADDSDLDPVRSDKRFSQVVKDAEGDAATRRLTETMERYQKLTRKHVESSVAGGVQGGVSGGVQGGVEGGIRGGVEGGTKFKFNSHHDDWYDVGLDLLRLRRHDESIHAFRQSIAANEKVANSMYNIACAYSLKGDAANGMEWLEKSIENGFSSDDKLQNDPDIRLLREQASFARLRGMAQDLELRGCCDDDGDDDEARSWKEAAAHHRSITQKYPNSGRAWFNLGYTALQARDFPSALEGFQRAINLNHRPGTSSYNLACAHALRGDKDAAFAWLDKARKAGFELRSYLTKDEDLESLHDDPRYIALKKELKADTKWKITNHKGNLDFDFDFDF